METTDRSGPERALALLGAFTRLQTFIDDFLARRFLESRIPSSAEVLGDLAIKRVRDRDRPKLLAAIATDLGSDAYLDDFSNTFTKVKAVRDKIAHSPVLTPYPGGGLLISGLTQDNRFNDNKVVPRENLDELQHQCRWLVAQVMYVLYSSDIASAEQPDGTPMRMLRPPRLPKDWDGEFWADQTADEPAK